MTHLPPAPSRTLLAQGIELIQEDDTRRRLGRLDEQLSHSSRPASDVHLNKVRP